MSNATWCDHCGTHELVPPIGTYLESSCYEKIEQVGEGTYGKVFRARHTITGLPVALKKIRVHNENMGLPLTALREIKILKELSHPNMIKLLEVVTSSGQGTSEDSSSDLFQKEQQRRGSLFLVLEYMEHDLAGLIDMQYEFSPQAIKFISKQLLEVLGHLHDNRYLHRDIKCSNLLLDHNLHLKLADFGLARRLKVDDKDALLTNRVITLWYRPPELLLGATRYGPAIDMWGVGCIIAEIIIGKPLFSGKQESEQLEMIFKILGTPSEHIWPEIVDLPNWAEIRAKIIHPNKLKTRLVESSRKVGAEAKMTSDCIDLITELLIYDPKDRLGAKSAIGSSYFTAFPKCPGSHLELGPLNLAESGRSYHEFQTKKHKKEIARRKAAEEKAKRDRAIPS